MMAENLIYFKYRVEFQGDFNPFIKDINNHFLNIKFSEIAIEFNK